MAKLNKAEIIDSWKARKEYGLKLLGMADECLQSEDYEVIELASIQYIHASNAFLRSKTRKEDFSDNIHPVIYCLDKYTQALRKMITQLKKTAEVSPTAKFRWDSEGKKLENVLRKDLKRNKIMKERIDYLFGILTHDDVLPKLLAGKVNPGEVDEMPKVIGLNKFKAAVKTRCKKLEFKDTEADVIVNYLGSLFIFAAESPERIEDTYKWIKQLPTNRKKQDATIAAREQLGI
ncbi:hypothetical protein ACFLQI_00445 [Candidatus Undinarchaeota archaeon]